IHSCLSTSPSLTLSSSLYPMQLSSLLQLSLMMMMMVLQLLQPAVAKEEEVYKPDKDEQAANINPNYRFRNERFFHDPLHVNGQIRDRWCQERCMRHCYCTYGHSCRRSCIAHCDRGPYTGGSIDPFMHSRSKRAASSEGAAPAAQQQEQPEETDNDKLPSWQKLAKDSLPYLNGFEYDSRAILRRKTGRPVWNPLTKDPGAKQERLYDTRWGALCQDNGN
ncbi:hypothetical protein PENTCL1PPCAC_23996, partial [Pristionchus entomophagus]